MNMKTTYTEPELEVIEFFAEDVITDSVTTDGNGTVIIKT